MFTSKLLDQINSTFAASDPRRPNSNIELEVRFGQFKDHRFTTGVSWRSFDRLRKFFSQKTKPVTTVTTDYIYSDIRKTVTVPAVETEEPQTIWVEKTRLWDQIHADYPIRIAMSRETAIPPIDVFTPKVIRTKKRLAFGLYNARMRLDLTTVDMKSEENIDTTRYEVELEILDPQIIPHLEGAVTIILKQLFDTVELYTQSEKEKLIDYINATLTGWTRPLIDHRPIVQARNLKLRDLVWGGLIGNPQTSYTVTHKADGVRKLLVFHPSGIWLVMAPLEIMKVSSENIKELNGTICDGESIPPEHRRDGAPNSRIWYITFDCLSTTRLEWVGHQGDVSIQNYPHNQRMQYCQGVADRLKTNLIFVTTKAFREFNTAEEFFSIMRQLFSQQPSLSYRQDGFLFTPERVPYNPHSDQLSLNQRVLTDYPDICKFKPKEQLTIDLSISWKATPTGRQLELYAGDHDGGLVRFTGDRFNPFNPATDIDITAELTKEAPNGTIVEYGWDYQHNLLVPKKVREKLRPNRLDIAVDVWEDIHNPITEETLKGDSFTLVRRYHNRIKRQLLNLVPESITEPTLLDIGSGRGGDVSKWMHFRRIVAVEPNVDYLPELERRINNAGLKDRVRIINTGGENTELITRTVLEFIGSRVSMVSIMLSLSFFWQSESLLNGLLSTIVSNLSPTGRIVFLTVDGDSITQIFDPAFGSGVPLTELNLGMARLYYYDQPPSLMIDIKDTIVEQQTEWLVHLDDIKIRLKQYGLFLSTIHRADKERFLSQSEAIFTQMYSHGWFDFRPDLSTVALSPQPTVITVTPPVPVVEPTPPIPIAAPTPPILIVAPTPPIPITAPTPVIPITAPTPVIPIAAPTPPIPITAPTPVIPIVAPTPPMESVLLMLPVVYDASTDRGIGDDAYQVINCTWFDGSIVRIACIGDGSCFFHAVLKAYYDDYSNNPSYVYRSNFVRQLRRDLAYALMLPDPTGGTYYDTANNGTLKELYLMQVNEGLQVTDDFGVAIDYSLEGIQRLLNSRRDIGDEVYKYIADMLGIDIYIMRATTRDLYPHNNTVMPGIIKNAIVVTGNGLHYEVIGLDHGQYFQTVFSPDEPFIKAIKLLVHD